MEENHINIAIQFADLVRTTLGPRGMNKMVVNDGKGEVILTNDGATIIQNVKGGNPIVDLFKNLAISQESAIGDGTSTAVIIAGQLLQNALALMNKGLHPTTIINGYNLAKIKSMEFLSSKREPGETDKIIRTAFGTKIPSDIIHHFVSILQNVKNFENLKQYKMPFSDPVNSEIFNGYVFPGFTINERMKKKTKGKIAVLDFASTIESGDFQITDADELLKISEMKKRAKKDIVASLKRNKVDCVLYTDTNPEFESYLTDQEITGIVVFQREHLDGISKAINARVCSSVEDIDTHLGEGEVTYVKQLIGNKGHIFVGGKEGMETLVLHGPTEQTLNEMERAVQDVVGLLKHETDCVIGAGAIETSLALALRDFANEAGGKEQLAIEKFAESIESIPLIIAENAGLDAIEILTNLKTYHKKGQTDFGVDMFKGISDARKRGIVEPVLVKIHAINSATNVANLILKLDKILIGEGEKE